MRSQVSAHDAMPTLPCTIDGAVVQGHRERRARRRTRSPTAFATSGPPLTDDGELVAADAGHHVAGAHAAAQPLGEDEQEFVAGGVAATVVDALEVVEVDEQHAHVSPALQHPVGDLLEQRAVGQPGEGVAEHLVLVEPPGGEVRQARGEHEGAVDPCPQPGFVRRGVAEHHVRVHRADEAVVGDDHDQGDAVGHPVLVERDHADHDEEDEVRLGDALPELHEHGRRHHQAQRRGRGLTLAAQPGRGGEDGGPADRQEDGDRTGLSVPLQPGDGHEDSGGEEAQTHDGVVPALPHGFRQQATLGQQTRGPVSQFEDHSRRIGPFRTFL